MPKDAAAELPDAALSETQEFEVPAELLERGNALRELNRFFEPLPEVSQQTLGTGTAAWLTSRSPGKASLNEDAVAVLPINQNRGLLFVADGLGGHRGGREASRQLLQALKKATRRMVTGPVSAPLVISRVVPIPTVTPLPAGEVDSRAIILDQIERVNRRLIRSRTSGASTLALVEFHGARVRTYHIGDSEVLIVSRQGRVKYATVSHSPVGYAYEAGLLTEEDALLHPDRHLVSNVVGSESMSVQIGPWVTLSPCDTVLLGSDGLFDNLRQAEIIEYIRKGKLPESVRQLAERARKRMTFPAPDRPSKPDDLTILAYRPMPEARRSATERVAKSQPAS
ncbi:PP2C family protein-serine/threonine phosphatase [Planctomicrobium sp. SH664]|uniref:PP2C family protein-serine/threonine phosphatase n=1 Tax=Planctomicrobium sp. SH664 TaxID=3448125 RepID=UPI003F5B344B